MYLHLVKDLKNESGRYMGVISNIQICPGEFRQLQKKKKEFEFTWIVE